MVLFGFRSIPISAFNFLRFGFERLCAMIIATRLADAVKVAATAQGTRLVELRTPELTLPSPVSARSLTQLSHAVAASRRGPKRQHESPH